MSISKMANYSFRRHITNDALVFIRSCEKKDLLTEIQSAQATKKRITRKTSQSGMFIEWFLDMCTHDHASLGF